MSKRAQFQPKGSAVHADPDRISAADFLAMEKAVKRKNKYGAKRTQSRDGKNFHSAGEASRYECLLMLQRAGEICDLETQVRFPLIVNGSLVCEYVADFTYRENGKLIIEDFKGVETPVFKIKASLFKAIFETSIRITGAS